MLSISAARLAMEGLGEQRVQEAFVRPPGRRDRSIHIGRYGVQAHRGVTLAMPPRLIGDNARHERALVVIDVQESFRQRPIWAAISDPEIAKQVQWLVETFRARRELVIWVLHTEPGTGGVFDPASGFVRLIDGLSAREGEPVVHKTSHNAFTTTNLQQLLTAQGVGSLVLSGIRTEQCVETTARVGSDLGYEVTVVIDATATNPIEHRSAPPGRSVDEILADPLTLGTAEVIARTEYALAGRFATISTVEELTL